ncbi:MAG: NAD(P)-dependent glycerol-3-phosphate dehydrogenase [Candidatus Marinimicrobia bacterium]|nr:NAD(P)-dependent glycerol-3-phosphate dehydrogenase [Candidatus Neomarinimicrobiota bacterium]
MKVSVIGAGSWGTTIGLHLFDLGHSVTFWEYSKERVKRMNTEKVNDLLPNRKIPDAIHCSNDICSVLKDPDLIVTAVPSHALRSALQSTVDCRPASKPLIVNISKGIENDSLKRMSEVITESISWPFEPVVTLSGPSHAEEVSEKLPTLLVAASENEAAATRVQKIFTSERLRVYTSNDLLGVELGGSLKNVIAIAAGICDGVGFGDNTKTALIVRGAFEITRMGVALGANSETFSGLSGMGDLIVTGMSRHSRNRYVGEQLGKGLKLKDILAEMSMVAEGVHTARSAYQLSQKSGVEMPIASSIYRVLFEDSDPLKEVNRLMTRDSREEWHSL